MIQKFGIDFEGDVITCLYIQGDDDAKKVIRLFEKSKAEVFGFDTETTWAKKYKEHPQAGLDPHLSRIRLLQLYDPEKKVCAVWDLFHVDLALFKELFKTREFVAHYALFDIGHLRHKGIRVPNCDCTMIMASTIHNAVIGTEFKGLGGLDKCINREFKYYVPKEFQKSDWSKPELDIAQIKYAALDVYLVSKLRDKYAAKLKKLKMWKVYRLFRAVQQPVVSMMLRGIKMDKKEHIKRIYEWEDRRYWNEKKLEKVFGTTNLRSPNQMTAWIDKNISEDKKSIWPKTESGKFYATDYETLVEFKDEEFIGPLVEYKKYDKLCGSYGRSLLNKVSPATGRVHGSFTIGQTRTGRMSGDLQQFPRDNVEDELFFRKLFIPEQGNVFVVADYSQIELRVAGEISGDPVIRKAYEKGIDLHNLMGMLITGKKSIKDVTKEERQEAKPCFSADTEVLTPRGWVYFKDYDGKTPVAQYALPVGVETNHSRRQASRFNTELISPPFTGVGGEITFVKPLDFKKYRNSKFLHMEDRNTDILATPNHIILHTLRDMVPKAIEFKDVKGSKCFVYGAGYLRINPVVSSDWTRIIAAAIADGSFNKKALRYGFSKRRKARRLQELYKRVGIHLPLKVNESGVYTFYITEGFDLIQRYVSKTKDLSWDAIYELDSRAFLEESSFWDGHEIAGHTRDRVVVTSASKQTIDVMQAMCALNGVKSNSKKTSEAKGSWRAYYRISYSLRSLPTHQVNFNNDVKAYPKKGTSYCVQVPSSYILIRRKGKVCIMGNCNFGQLYGSGAAGLQRQAKNSYQVIWTLEESQKYVDLFRGLYKVLRKWQVSTAKLAEKTLISITPMGKIRKLQKGKTYTVSLNVPIQGGAGEVLQLALVYLDRVFSERDDVWLVNAVHDEIIVECKEDQEVVAWVKETLEDCMTRAYKKIFPKATTRDLVEAHFGKSWAEAKP